MDAQFVILDLNLIEASSDHVKLIIDHSTTKVGTFEMRNSEDNFNNHFDFSKKLDRFSNYTLFILFLKRSSFKVLSL